MIAIDDYFKKFYKAVNRISSADLARATELLEATYRRDGVLYAIGNGHTVAVPGGPECPCGRLGCLEAVASGSAIARAGREALGNPDLTASDVDLLALSGDVRAIRVMQDAGRHLGRALANAVSLLDAAVVVVGGGVSRACAPWWDAVNAAFRENVFAWNDGTELVRAALGPDVGIWGAAALFS